MYSIFFVEDDPGLQSTLKTMFRLFIHDCIVAGCTGSVTEALRDIPAQKPDIALLDVNLQGGMGFEILDTLGKTPAERGFDVIFFTVRDERICLQEAINTYQAAGYLIKPFEKHELTKALDVARHRVEQRRLSATYNQLFCANALSAPVCTVVNPIDRTPALLRLADVFALSADGDWSIVHSTRGNLPADKRLGEWEQELNASLFVRIHDAHIVNLAHVIRRDPKTTRLELATGAIIPVARRRKALVEERLRHSAFGCAVGELPETSPPPRKSPRSG